MLACSSWVREIQDYLLKRIVDARPEIAASPSMHWISGLIQEA